MSSRPENKSQSDDSTASNYFLRDEPVTITKDDEFGHYQYVETLAEIIQEVDLPWQIALFGRWGTGKSSILEAIAEELPTVEGETQGEQPSDSQVEYVEFDAWKHAEDSIRTEFLLTLDQKLCRDDEKDGLLGEAHITEELYDVTVAEEPEGFDPPEVTKNALRGYGEPIWKYSVSLWRDLRANAILTISIVLVAVFIAFQHFGIIQIKGKHMTTILTALGIPLFIYLLKELSGPKGTYQRMVSPRKEWSGAYEKIFKEILEENSDRNGEPDRYVIAIDNLDRCEAETVYDVLISMKTFFRDNRCVYIVPCDGQTLRQHVASISVAERDNQLGEDPISDDDEFLRKFFQTTVQLPPLEVRNVESFANDQINELRPERRPTNQEAVVDVLTKLDVQTPRRIKHTINRFLSLRELAERLEEAGQLEYESVTTCEAFLVKMLLIQEEFPDIYQMIRTDPELFTRLHEMAQTIDINEDAISTSDSGDRNVSIASDGGVAVNDGTSRNSDDLSEAISGSPTEILQKKPRLHRFLQETQEYYTNPHPFIYLGDAQFNELFGQFEKFRGAIRNGETADALSELRDVPDPSTADIDRLVSDIFTRITNESNTPSAKTSAESPETEPHIEETTESNARKRSDKAESEADEMVTAVGTIFELIPACESTVSRGLMDGIQQVLTTTVIHDRLFEFDPEGVWHTIVRHERETDSRHLTESTVEYAISEGLREPESAEYEFFANIIASIDANPESTYEHDLAQRVRAELQTLFEEGDLGLASRNVGNLLQENQQAAKLVLTNSLYRTLVELLPATSSSTGIDLEVFETLRDFDTLLDDAEEIDEKTTTELTDTLVCTVLEAGFIAPDAIRSESVARLEEINLQHVSEEVGWEIHRRINTVFEQASPEQISEEYFDLIYLWFSVHEDVIGFGRPPADRPEGIQNQGEWETTITVEKAFSNLFEKLQERAVIKLTEEIVDRQLDVFNKHVILRNFLRYVPDLLSGDQLLIDVLELVDEGELAPVEEHIEGCLDDPDSGRIARWARIAADYPEKFDDVQTELVQECILRSKREPAKLRTHLLQYPAEVYREFADKPALQNQILDLIRESITARRRQEQRVAAVALRRLDESVEERASLLQRASKLVEREYRSGNRPAKALEMLVLDEADTASVESIHSTRFAFIWGVTDADEKVTERKKALDVLLDHYKENPSAINRDELDDTIESLEKHYRVDSPFADQISRLKSLATTNLNQNGGKSDE